MSDKIVNVLGRLKTTEVTVTVNSEWTANLIYWGNASISIPYDKIMAVTVVSAQNFRPSFAEVIGSESQGYYIRAFSFTNNTEVIVRILYKE